MKLLLIYTIYSCPIPFCTLDLTLEVWLLCYNEILGQMLRCFKRIKCVLFFVSINTELKEMKFLMNYTIFLCPASFFHLDLTLVVGRLCYNGMLGQMLRFQCFCKINEISENPLYLCRSCKRALGDCGTSGKTTTAYILVKRPFRITTGGKHVKQCYHNKE